MDEARFWSMIESAWAAAGGKVKSRERLAAGKLSEGRACDLGELLTDAVCPALRAQLAALPAEELLAFDRILERKLYDTDRADIHARTDGSDDGFLYCRGFMVGIGRRYYEAVAADPDRAVADAECGDLCYISSEVYEERFGDMPDSGICRETQSNSAGWPGDA